jgi:hypothetical protein
MFPHQGLSGTEFGFIVGDLITQLKPFAFVALGIYVTFPILKRILNLFWHADGTTNWLGSKWSAYDQLTYSPWKGYKRYRSKHWNYEHMP